MTPSKPELRVSVIVTNWNYSNYLRASIDSVLHQTRPVDELIVVDDGSTDGSRGILAAYGDRVRSVLCENGGQASAFNTGFLASTGDIVIFLDADDVLRPEAVETVKRVWTDDVAAVCYRMELIDREGMSRGLYPIEASGLDQRPHLVETGAFTFLPTSANAFARRVVERACPLPTKRWRISADAFMLRVAAFSGRILPLRQVLGSYRIHESNNYYRVGAAELWRQRRDLTDIADLAAYFAKSGALKGDGRLSDAERLRLRIAAVRSRAALVQLGQKEADPGGALRRLAADLVMSRAPLLPRVALAGAALVASLGLWRSRLILNWMRFPDGRSLMIRAALAGLGHASLSRYLRSSRTPRWRAPLPLDTSIVPRFDLRGEQCLGAGWSIIEGSPPHSRARHLSLSVLVPPTPDPLQVELELSVHAGSFDKDILIEARIGGELLTRMILSGTSSLRVPLPAGTAAFGADVAIDLSIAGHTKGSRHMLKRLISMPATVTLETIRIATVRPALDHASAEDGLERRFAEFIGAAADGNWKIEPDGSASLLGTKGRIGLTAAADNKALIAVIGLPADQPKGWMRIVADDTEVFTGEWGASPQLRLRLPWAAGGGFRTGEMTFAFAPADALELRTPKISTIAFRGELPDHDESRARGLPANPGQQFTFKPDSGSVDALSQDWLIDERNGATLAVGRGQIRILMPPNVRNAAVELAFEPVFPAPEGQRHVVTVSTEDETLAQVLLAGEGDVAVPLRPGAQVDGPLTLIVSSVFAEVDEAGQGFAQDGTLRPAPIDLRGLRFSGTIPAPAGNSRLPRRSSGYLEALLADAAVVLEGSGATRDTGQLATLRRALITSLEKVDQRALLSLLAPERTLPALMGIQDALGPLPPGVDLPWLLAPRSDIERLRAVPILMLSMPASAAPWLSDLAAIPAPFLRQPSFLAAYLGKDPQLALDDAGENYEQFIEELIRSADDLISRDLPDSPRRALAVEVIRHLWPQRLLFLPGSHRRAIRALGRCVERHLTLEGYLLAQGVPPRTEGRRLRVGIILRHLRPTPEVSIVSAMLQALDQRQFEPVLIVLSSIDEVEIAAPWDRFQTVSLSGLGVGEAVDLIRSLGLDIFIQGAFFNMFERLSAIAAHRLAPLQLATTAIFPVTTGLSSFDGILSSALIEPPDQPDDYAEPLIAIAGPIQAFAVRRGAGREEVETPILARSRLGLPLDGLLFASGAMMQKIGADLVEAWAEILASVPGSRLVLYPYARNWNVDFAINGFEDWLAGKMAAKDVSSDRILFLPTLSPADVRRLLRSVDLYLDSFPYAGAATVTEALEEGLPVVSMRTDRQRGRQGAGWLAAYGLEDDVAGTVAAYVARATALAVDPILMKERKQFIATRNAAGAPHTDLATFGRALSRVLIETAAAHGIYPGAIDPPALPVETGASRYLFLHLRGAAGESVLRILGRSFNIVRDYRGRDGGLAEPVNLDDLGAGDLVAADFPAAVLDERYPQIRRDPAWRLITMIRDPLELSLSRYFRDHARRAYDPDFRPRTLHDHLADDQSYCANHLGLDAADWRQALDRYWFIGTTERLEECLRFLAGEMGADLATVPRLNATPRPIVPDPADVDAFARRHALDYEVYNEIRARLDRRLRGG